jgi:hypothetical protein
MDLTPDLLDRSKKVVAVNGSKMRIMRFSKSTVIIWHFMSVYPLICSILAKYKLIELKKLEMGLQNERTETE